MICRRDHIEAEQTGFTGGQNQGDIALPTHRDTLSPGYGVGLPAKPYRAGSYRQTSPVAKIAAAARSCRREPSIRAWQLAMRGDTSDALGQFAIKITSKYGWRFSFSCALPDTAVLTFPNEYIQSGTSQRFSSHAPRRNKKARQAGSASRREDRPCMGFSRRRPC
jgi:hypothetical protein